MRFYNRLYGVSFTTHVKQQTIISSDQVSYGYNKNCVLCTRTWVDEIQFLPLYIGLILCYKTKVFLQLYKQTVYSRALMTAADMIAYLFNTSDTTVKFNTMRNTLVLHSQILLTLVSLKKTSNKWGFII